MKKLKLSEKQTEAIKFMRDGYELGQRTGWGSSVWMQKGRCGHGGEYAKITFGTFHSIIDKGLVQLKKGQNPFAQPQIFELTELGNTFELG